MMCIARIVEFLQNHARNAGGQSKTPNCSTKWPYALQFVEETAGPQHCVITLHSLIHFKEDIMAFSGLDKLFLFCATVRQTV